jgi:DMSO/TMAO reductase YedYZ molybdopterin-dependent catalytic subunit
VRLTKHTRLNAWLVLLLIAAVTMACQTPVANEITGTAMATALTTPAPTATPNGGVPCVLPTIQTPPYPEVTPALNQLDPETGLHVTGALRHINLATYRLKVTGAVSQTLELTYDQLRCLPKTTSEETLVCPGFFKDVATWGGVPLEEILQLAGLQTGASVMRLISDDGYAVDVTLAEARKAGAYLAYELEGKPIPQLHGFPVRAVLPGITGGKWVKWLSEIQVR